MTATLSQVCCALRSAPQLLAEIGLSPDALSKTLSKSQIGSGFYAHVFRLPDGRVLKVTRDETDAQVAELVRRELVRRPPTRMGIGVPGLPIVYSVHRLKIDRCRGTWGDAVIGKDGLYAIVLEKVRPLFGQQPGSNEPGAHYYYGTISQLMNGLVEAKTWSVNERSVADVFKGLDLHPPPLTPSDLRHLDEALAGVRWLLSKGVVVTDLHWMNFGVSEKTGAGVFFDFGAERVRRTPRVPMAKNGHITRSVFSPTAIEEVRDVPQVQPGEKPVGLWYTCDDEWIRWLRSEAPKRAAEQRHRYEIEVDLRRICIIRSGDELDQFSKEYGVELVRYVDEVDRLIDWPKVAKDFDGIEICPHLDDRHSTEFWYSGWDVASGCIWRARSVKSIRETKMQENPKIVGHVAGLAANGVTIDSVSGLGAVGVNQRIDHLGLRVMMRPSVFHRLAFPLTRERAPSADALKELMAQGVAIGPPLLEVEIPAEWEYGDFRQSARVTGHEGRNRMYAAMELYGDEPVEVHLFDPMYRRSQLTREWIERLKDGIHMQDSLGTGEEVHGPLFTMKNESTTEERMTPNRASGRVLKSFNQHFDKVEAMFPDFGQVDLYEDERAGSDNGAGSERQFGYCKDGKPISIAFAPKTETLPTKYIDGLMAHEFGHAIEFRYGRKELERLFKTRLPDSIERRADKIAERVFGRPIEYGDLDIQCIACGGKSVRPRRLG